MVSKILDFRLSTYRIQNPAGDLFMLCTFILMLSLNTNALPAENLVILPSQVELPLVIAKKKASRKRSNGGTASKDSCVKNLL